MSEGGRLHFLDNVRWSMIVLVLLVHSAVTYGPVGSWFYHDPLQLDALSEAVLIIIPTYAQTFFMGLLFFVAGYFVPASLERKGPKRFLGDRAVRLGVPALLFMLVIAPITALMMMGDMALSLLPSYLADPTRWDSGPLWFVIALLAFSVAYAAWATYVGEPRLFRSAPRNLAILVLVLAIIASTVAVRLFYPIGTAVWNMQLCFFPQYIAMFLLGTGAQRGGWLETLGRPTAKLWLSVAAVMAVLAFPLLFVTGGALDGDIEAFAGGLRWQAISLVVIEEFMGVGLSLGLLVWFRERRNVKGRVDDMMSSNSFSVYVLHAPVLVGIALLLSSTGLPALVRFGLLFLAGLAATLVLSVALRRVPLLGKVL